MKNYSQEDFMRYVNKDEMTGCWNWMSSSTAYKGVGFRQVAFTINFGDTNGYSVGSTCKNIKCVCPDHLFLKSRTFFNFGEECTAGHLIDDKNGIFYRKQNRYACAKCRAIKGLESGRIKKSITLGIVRTLCRNGHDLTIEGALSYSSSKTGTCRECLRIGRKNYKLRQKAKQ